MALLVLLCSLVAALLAIALLREIRLRQALQKLLVKLFNKWRTLNEKKS